MLTPEEFANLPTVATWSRCRKISDQQWTADSETGERMLINGRMPDVDHVLVSGRRGDRQCVVGKIVLNKAE